MADSAPAIRVRSALGAWLKRLLRSLRTLSVKLYSAALFVVIVWLSYSAVRYLFVSVWSPGGVPPPIAKLPHRLDEQMLQGSVRDWSGLASTANPRSPLAHYHRFDTWLQNDPLNDCTRSGCHAPLPHSKRKEDRAFLNMHATALHCGVCHTPTDEATPPLTWYRLRDGTPTSAPPLLAALAWFERWVPTTQNGKAPITDAEQQTLVTLLQNAAAETDNDIWLRKAAERVASVRVSHPAFRDELESARAVVMRSVRGAYGSKLALRDRAGNPILGGAGIDAAAAGARDGARPQAPLTSHPRMREQPLDCTACHDPEAKRIDFSALGYPPQRISALHDNMIFQMIQNIREGRPFHLPRMLQSAPQP